MSPTIIEKVNEVNVNDPKTIILSLIKKDDEGIDIDRLIMETKFPVEQINSVIASLMESNEIYEPRPGRLRVM